MTTVRQNYLANTLVDLNPDKREVLLEDVKQEDSKKEVQQERKTTQAPRFDDTRARLIARLNSTLQLGFGTLMSRVTSDVFEKGLRNLQELQLTQQEKNTVQQAAQASPQAYNSSLMGFALNEIINHLNEQFNKRKFKNNEERRLKLAENNTLIKMLTKINEKGSFTILDFSNDKEALDVLNNPERLTKVLGLAQTEVDWYMEQTGTLLEDPRPASQQLAEHSLKIAKAVIETEKTIRVAEIQFTKKVALGIGRFLDVFA